MIQHISLFWPLTVSVILIMMIGIYSVIMTSNLLRVLIGLELMIKAVTLFIVLAGFVSGYIAVAQAMVITLIVIEVVMMTVSSGIILGVHKHTKSLDVSGVRRLKG
jgi:multicomponent Na+:H+ antiporter subunit C